MNSKSCAVVFLLLLVKPMIWGQEGADPSSVELPSFLTRDYPHREVLPTSKKVLASSHHLKVWGFQDLIAPAGSTAVEMNLFRSRIAMENKGQLFGTGYATGPAYLRDRTKIRAALENERRMGGSPMITVMGFFNPDGSRIQSLPMTIHFYGGKTGGLVTADIPSPGFGLEKNFAEDIVRARPRDIDPEDMRAVHSYSGMVSDAGFDGHGYVVPITLRAGQALWTTGEGYFGEFSSGRLLRRVELASFGGPLALQAQRDEAEKGQFMGPVLGLLAVGAVAVIAGSAVEIGGKSKEFVKEAMIEGLRQKSSGQSSQSRSTAATPEVKPQFKRYAGTSRTFEVSALGNVGGVKNMLPGYGGTVTVNDSAQNRRLSFNYGETLGTKVGDSITVDFDSTGQPIELHNNRTGKSAAIQAAW